MWDESGQAISPAQLTITFRSLSHMTVLDTVQATVQLDFTGRYRSSNPWRCTVQSKFQLVDHGSVLPDLWVLRQFDPIGKKWRTLALYSPTVGVFSAVFVDPATAAGFARWLRDTRARRVASYELGSVATDDASDFLASPAGESKIEVRQFGAASG
jgi:hypothetical protein